MKSCVMALFCAFDRGAIPARARWSVARRESGWGRRRTGPARATGRNRRSRGVASEGFRWDSRAPLRSEVPREGWRRTGSEVGVDCRPRRTLGEGSAGEKRVRGSAKGKTTWGVVSRAVGKGIQKGCAVETKGSGLEEVAMVSHVEAGGHEDEAPLWAKAASKAEVQTLAGSLGGSRRFFPPVQTRNDAPTRLRPNPGRTAASDRNSVHTCQVAYSSLKYTVFFETLHFSLRFFDFTLIACLVTSGCGCGWLPTALPARFRP